MTASTNPHNGVRFPRLELVRSPGTLAMPLVPVRAVDDVLEGGTAESCRHAYC